jgi:hypothetical protein
MSAALRLRARPGSAQASTHLGSFYEVRDESGAAAAHLRAFSEHAGRRLDDLDTRTRMVDGS